MRKLLLLVGYALPLAFLGCDGPTFETCDRAALEKQADEMIASFAALAALPMASSGGGFGRHNMVCRSEKMQRFADTVCAQDGSNPTQIISEWMGECEAFANAEAAREKEGS